MDKKEKAEETDTKKLQEEQTEVNEEKGGFPEDVDFKRFLGCGS